MADGETLAEICRAWDVATGRIMAWLMADEKRYEMYCRSQEIAAHSLIVETIAMADEVFGKDDVPAAKLKIDTRFRVAAAHAPNRYASNAGLGGAGGVTVIVNRGGEEVPVNGKAVVVEG